MTTEQSHNEQTGLYPTVDEVHTNPPLYPKVEEFQYTNPPPPGVEEEAQKEQNLPYPKEEEFRDTNPPPTVHGEAQDKAKIEVVQDTNIPSKKKHGKKSQETHGNKAQDKDKWGTRIMGAPSAPSAHPQNQEAATWTDRDEENENITPNPYLVKGDPPQQQPPQPSKSPMEAVLQSFNKWAKEAENLGSNVWTNLRTGQSVPDAAWGKLSLGAKALTEGGFESLFKQTFSVEEGEKLRKTFACYFSTSTGPVAGTLYISTVKIAFCSDRPLSYTVPSGEKGWGHYRVAVPLVKIKAVNPSANKDKPAEKYVQVATVDNHEFWFMGFVNYDKALSNLQESITVFDSPTSHH